MLIDVEQLHKADIQLTQGFMTARFVLTEPLVSALNLLNLFVR
jgi:hypothetical protein